MHGSVVLANPGFPDTYGRLSNARFEAVRPRNRPGPDPPSVPPVRRLTAGFLITVLAGACSPSAPSSETAPSTDRPGPVVEVTHVFDGDSFEVLMDGVVTEIRLIGINAPEGDECHGDESRDALIELLSNGTIRLEEDPGGAGDADRYGRLLRYVSVGDTPVNETLLERGDAVALQSGHERREAFAAAATAAAEAGVGMWARDACGHPPPDGVAIVAVDYDPPGADETSLGAETVTIENTGAAPVDLEGWTLRDESSQNRYTFASLVLEPGDRVTVAAGCGADTRNSRFWCADSPVWSNGGDTAIIQDARGNVVDWWIYTATK